MSRYLVPAAVAEAELRERGSRFLARVLPASDESQARGQIEALHEAYRDATHVCWAWRLGFPARERSSDAGEPGGTAGVPILRAIAGRELTDVLVAVVRWFGGTKLGKGGLARAYAAAAGAALDRASVVERRPTVELTVELPYEKHGAVQRLIHPPEVRLAAEEYGEVVRLVLVVDREREASVRAALAALSLEV